MNYMIGLMILWYLLYQNEHNHKWYKATKALAILNMAAPLVAYAMGVEVSGWGVVATEVIGAGIYWWVNRLQQKHQIQRRQKTQ